ncbi:MAG: exo-alpha-sialidase [Pirellulales bacterium]|nr:exo-alpha-sialidase [Pirellulales bacterium]
MHLEDRGLVVDAAAQPASRRSACFPTLCVLDCGGLLCSFQVGPTKNAATSTLGICRSDDRGATWRPVPAQFETVLGGVPGSLAMGEMIESRPGRILLFTTWLDRTDPTRPLFDPATEGILHSKLLLAVSEDGGQTWSGWQEAPTPGLTGCAGTGPILKWPDGTLAFPLESYKEYDDPRPSRHGAWVLVTADGGRTFGKPWLVAQHPEHKVYYWDQRLTPGPGPGEFTALFWTHDLEHKEDLSVHLRRASLSVEDFRQSPIRPTTVPGQIAAPLWIGEDHLLAFVVDRRRPGAMTLWQSRDGGDTWPQSDALVVYTHDEQARLSQGQTNVDFKQYWEDMGKWTFGHPVIRPLGSGRVLLAFYAGTPDCLSIHWARVAL